MGDTRSGRKAYGALMQLKALSAVRLKKSFFNSEEWEGMERGWIHGE
jgi:hypothetical protein